MIRSHFKSRMMTAPKSILVVCALFLGYIPCQAHAQAKIPETTHSMTVSPTASGVCSVTSKYDGEVHRITITWVGAPDRENVPPIDLKVGKDGYLWKIDKRNPTTVEITAVTLGLENFSALFTVKKIKPVNVGGSGGGSAYDEGKGYANQIQIHAFPPGGGDKMPRPTTKDTAYYGFLAPNAANKPTNLNLLFNSKDKDIGKNTITLNVPNGVEVPGYHVDDNDIPVSSSPITIPVKLMGNSPGPKTFKLKLENENGGIKSPTAEDSVTLLPVEIEFFKPDTNSDQQWQDDSNKMEWGSIYTFEPPKNHALKFKVKMPGVILTQAILDLIKIEVTKHADDPTHPPSWVQFKLSEIGRISINQDEVWCGISASDMTSKVKIPAVNSTIRSASMDWIADPSISSFSDSNFVDSWWKSRPKSYALVNSKGPGNSSEATIKDPASGENIPAFSAKANREYLISGGAMYVAVRFAGGVGSRALCHETPDWLYVSGHGWHSAQPAEPGAPSGYPSGCLETIDGDGFGQRQYVVPEEVNWNGVDFVIIAGCSVLDINDYNGFYSGADHSDSPGKRWAATGPGLLLGYNQGGPSDKNGGTIITKRFFMANPLSFSDEAKVIEWKSANAAEKAWNACAIIPSSAYYYFDYISGIGALTAEWTRIPKASW